VPVSRSNSPTPDLVNIIQPIFTPTLADAHSEIHLPTVTEGDELESPPGLSPTILDSDSESETDGGVEHLGSNTPEGPQHRKHRTRSGRRVRLPTHMKFKSSIKFKCGNM
jgi:hypothetical protein